jgi:N-sulfoglucosamine sulfohydrolase
LLLAQSTAEKPNILWISVEDISPLLEVYGDKSIRTPNIDRLAKEGITFMNAFATAGVCAPSRSSIITGMYPVSIGTHNMRTGPHYAYREPEVETYTSYRSLKDVRGRNVPEYAAVPPPYVKVFTEYLRAAGSQPLVVGSFKKIAARAVRLGYKTSEVSGYDRK